MRTPFVIALTIVILVDVFISIVSVIATMQFAYTHRALPTVFGIRLYSGPFEALGLDQWMVTGLVYAVVNGLKIMAATWIWHSRMDGAILDLILVGLSAIFWYGYALPYGVLVGVAQLALVALTWNSLT
jgi:hypothetical protein